MKKKDIISMIKKELRDTHRKSFNQGVKEAMDVAVNIYNVDTHIRPQVIKKVSIK